MTEPQAKVVLDPGRARVFVRGRQVTDAGLTFAARAFACPSVVRVDHDLAAGTMEMQLAADATAFPRAVAELSEFLRGTERVPIPADAFGVRRGTIHRLGRRLITWRVGSQGRSGLRFRHWRMRRDRWLARQAERVALTVPGVHDARLAGFSSDLVIHVDPATFDGDGLLGLLQHLVDERAKKTCDTSPRAMVGKTAILGVLAATDLAMPALAPVSSVLLVGSNLGTISSAASDLRRLRVGPAVVATAIVCGTLVTGQFLASGIMAWSFDFWRRRHRRDVEAERQLLIEDAVPLPSGLTERLALDAPERVGPVSFRTWDVVTADSRVVSGGGVIDERAINGIPGVRGVSVGDTIPAGAVVMGGEGLLAVERPAEASRIGRVARLLAAATESRPGKFAPTAEAERLVDTFAGPTLATAGLGLLAGDVTTAVAVMRPDYGSAQAMSLSFEDLDAVACGLAVGCLVTAPRVLDALAHVDTLVVLDHPKLSEPELEVHHVENLSGGDESTVSELVRILASLARHIAGPRREALARFAQGVTGPLSDVVPQSFGDDRGIRIEHHWGNRTFVLRERLGDLSEHPALELEVDGIQRLRSHFRFGSELRASRALLRIKSELGCRLVLAADRDVVDRFHDGHHLAPHDDVILAALATMRADGRRLALVGLPEDLARIAAHGDVTIAMGLADRDAKPAGIVCLSSDVTGLADLFEASRDRCRKVRTSRRLSIIPNAACVAGAFLFGFTSVVAAVVTNLGTFGIYRRASSGLQQHRRRHWLRQRAVLPRLVGLSPEKARNAS